MSYCRFSSDDHRCDIYCYEGAAGFVTHVGARRVLYRDPLPPKLGPYPRDAPIEEREAWAAAWVARELRVGELFERAKVELIGLPHDGQSFSDATPEDFLATLLMLRAEGYRFPDDVLDTVRAELRCVIELGRFAQGDATDEAGPWTTGVSDGMA